MFASSNNGLTLALLADYHVAKGVFAFLQFFSPHSSARILELFEYALSSYIYCNPIPVLSNGTCLMQLGGGGEQNRATKNRTPVGRGTIEPSANNYFPSQAVRSCNLKRWISTVDSLVYKTAGKVGA